MISLLGLLFTVSGFVILLPQPPRNKADSSIGRRDSPGPE